MAAKILTIGSPTKRNFATAHSYKYVSMKMFLVLDATPAENTSTRERSLIHRRRQSRTRITSVFTYFVSTSNAHDALQ